MKVFGFAGWSGSGKTTLIEHVIPAITARGLRVSVIKHAHHGFDIDKPGKDSWRHREAGASEILLVSDQRWVLTESDGLESSLRLDAIDCELALAEIYEKVEFAGDGGY